MNDSGELDELIQEIVEQRLPDTGQVPDDVPMPIDQSPEDESDPVELDDSDQANLGTIYRKMPELANCYRRGRWSEMRSAENTCLGCRRVITSSEIVRLAKHVIRCKKVPQNKRRLIQEKLNDLPFRNDSDQQNHFGT